MDCTQPDREVRIIAPMADLLRWQSARQRFDAPLPWHVGGFVLTDTEGRHSALSYSGVWDSRTFRSNELVAGVSTLPVLGLTFSSIWMPSGGRWLAAASRHWPIPGPRCC
jgi:hypothetical protein